MKRFQGIYRCVVVAVAALLVASPGVEAQDLEVFGSLCVGFDCPGSPSYSDSTILMMENNTRIKFGDTSSSASFPPNDWEIQANSNSNGGANYLGFNDCGTGSNQGGCANDLVFAVEAGARQNALYVESDGDVGMGTNNPVVRIHTTDGDTPTLRLEQDGSSGFAPQTWDVAGNETSFFVRDATNGSTLPFRIRPTAASNSLVIDTDNDVGVGILSPTAPLHVKRTEASNINMLLLENAGSGQSRFSMITGLSGGAEWNLQAAAASFIITKLGSGSSEFELMDGGDLTIAGSLTVGPGGCTGCDLVFQPGYEIESIDEHAEFMWEKSHLPGVGPTPEDQPMNVSNKVGGMLNELEKAHIYIERLNERLKAKEEEVQQLKQQVSEINGLKERLAQLETLLTSSGSSR